MRLPRPRSGAESSFDLLRGNAPTVPLAWSLTAEVGPVGNSAGVARQCQGPAGCPRGFCTHLLAGDLPSASTCQQQPGTDRPRGWPADDDPTAGASGGGADGALTGEANPQPSRPTVPWVTRKAHAGCPHSPEDHRCLALGRWEKIE